MLLIFHHQSHIWQKFWFSIYGSKCCWPIELQDSLKCNISRKKWMMKYIIAMSRNIEIFYKLILPCWVCVSRHAQSTQNKKFAYLCNISRKARGMKWFFYLQINTKVFYKMILPFWVCATRVTQSTQNKKFAISLQYLKENGKNEVYFLLAEKHQRFLQIDFIILGVYGRACPNYSNKQVCYFFAIS